MSAPSTLVIQALGRQPYASVWLKMKDLTDARHETTLDQLWQVEHEPVFTQGLAGKAEHVLNPEAMAMAHIPVVQTDRGGQVTYHGPGQVVLYPLLDLERLGVGVRCLVDHLEQIVIDLLAQCEVKSHRKAGAPGVYIEGAKVASIGLKVKKGRTYHGLAVNVDMDLSPFSLINPCGMAGLAMTQLVDHCPNMTWQSACEELTTALVRRLGYHQTKSET